MRSAQGLATEAPSLSAPAPLPRPGAGPEHPHGGGVRDRGRARSVSARAWTSPKRPIRLPTRNGPGADRGGGDCPKGFSPASSALASSGPAITTRRIPMTTKPTETRFKFTDKRVAALPAHDAGSPSREREYADAALAGLKLLVSKCGRRYFHLRLRRGGVRVSKRLGEFGVMAAARPSSLRAPRPAPASSSNAPPRANGPCAWRSVLAARPPSPRLRPAGARLSPRWAFALPSA
jgi:hypothetical protein